MEQQWSSTTKSILWAIVIEMIAAIFAVIFGLLTVGSAAVNSSTGAGVFGILTALCGIAILAAFVIYFLKLCKFVTLQTNKPDADAISMVRNSVIVSIVAAICNFIPVVGGVICALLGIAASVMLILGFNSFSKSPVLPQIGLTGAGQLKVYAILALVGAVISLIPFVGPIINIICSIVGLIFLIMGWNNVSKGCPAAPAPGAPYA